MTQKGCVFLTLALGSPCAGRELAEMLAVFLTLAATTSTTSTTNDLYERLPRNDLYELDSHWSPQLPPGAHTFSAVGISYPLVFITQRGNASLPPVLVINASTGALVGAWGADAVAHTTTAPSTWGAHGVAVETCSSPCTSGSAPTTRVFVEDFTGHTVTAFDSDGRSLFQLGTPGVAGNGTDPLQFGNVADAAVASASTLPFSMLYFSDGDGGSANRVVAYAVPPSGTLPGKVRWATPAGTYSDPHSIALHQRTGLLVVANRGMNETRLLRASDGTDLGVLDCGFHFGSQGTPFGVRTLEGGGWDLLFVAAMDNPQDSRNQRILVVDASGLDASGAAKSTCDVVQEIGIPTSYSGPHLLGIDTATGELYAALVADSPK